MGRFIYIIILAISPFVLWGQYFLELHAESDDSFRSWEMIMEKDSTEMDGNLELTWAINNDFTQWQYSVDDLDGDINQKFKNNPGFWELRSEGKIVTIRQVWPGDFSEWKISHDGRSFSFRATNTYRLDEWSIVGDKYGELIMYTDTEMDPRDWIISDYTVESISFEERMAAIFIGLYSSMPKR